MTDDSATQHPLFTNPLVYQQTYAGEVLRNVAYGEGSRACDIYLPETGAQPAPVVVLITGYPDPGFEAMAGRKQMEIRGYQDWARLLAASGMAAVLYSNIDPVADAKSVLDFLRGEAAQLGIDPERIAIWACSGNVPNAINLAWRDSTVRCAVLLYGFMLDIEGSTAIEEASAMFRFANPNRGMDSFPENTPILVIGAGKDEFPGLNDSIDGFEAEAVARNSPVSVIRYPEGVHGFDLLDDSRRSIEMIKLCVGFLRLRLNVY